MHTNVYTRVQKYRSNIVMLAAKKSAGVASGMSLRNPLHMGDDALKSRSDVTVGASVAPQKGLMSSIFKKFPHMGKLFEARPGTTKAPGLFTKQVKLFCVISV